MKRPLTFNLDEVIATGPCTPEVEKAERLFKRGPAYTLRQIALDRQSETFWFVYQAAKRRRDVLRQMIEWVRAVGGDVADKADFESTYAVLRESRARRVQEYRKKEGIPRHVAKQRVYDEDFEALLRVFDDDSAEEKDKERRG